MNEAESLHKKNSGHLRFAVPVHQGVLNLHFGHSEAFALVDADRLLGKVHTRKDVLAPPHEPGLLPQWLGEREVDLIIAGGMGQKAQTLFTQRNIKVLTGAPSLSPEALVEAYLGGTLVTGANGCDH